MLRRANQREGAVSNSHVGAQFEQTAWCYFKKLGITLDYRFAITLGVGREKKRRAFDLGSARERILGPVNTIAMAG